MIMNKWIFGIQLDAFLIKRLCLLLVHNSIHSLDLLFPLTYGYLPHADKRIRPKHDGWR